jgi:hypothetical protein
VSEFWGAFHVKNFNDYDIAGFSDSFLNEFKTELGFYLDEVKRS